MTNKNLIDLEAMSVNQIEKLIKKAKKINTGYSVL